MHVACHVLDAFHYDSHNLAVKGADLADFGQMTRDPYSSVFSMLGNDALWILQKLRS